MTDFLANLPRFNAADIARRFPNGYRLQKVGRLDVEPGEPGGIPVAENLLSSGKSCGAASDSFSSTKGETKLSAELFDTNPANYTKEKALREIFNQRYSRMQFVNIDGELNLVTPEDFRLVPGEGDMEALEREMRESGQADLMWDSIRSVVTKSYSGSFSQNRLTKTVDALAAHYAAQKSILEGRFQGEELTEQLERLETVWQTESDRLADAYIKDVNGFLEENGQTGQADQFRESVCAALNKAAAGYEEQIARNPDLLRPAGEGEEWLNTHLGYLAASLQMSGRDGTEAQAEVGGAEREVFSLSELEIASRTVSRYQFAVREGYTTEHGMALDLAMLDMETDTAMRMKGAGDPLRELLEGLRERVIPKILARTDSYFAAKRDNVKPGWESPSWYPPVDRGLFQGIYDAVRNAYRQSGDVLAAIRTGAEAGRDLTARTVAKGGTASRWTVSLMEGGYWDTFYGAGSRYGGGQKSGYQVYAERWQSFLNELGAM